MQLDEDVRGFSFMKEGPLDMRMDQRSPITAEDIVNTWSEEDLGELFEAGEEPRWKKAAAAIVKARRKKRLKTTKDLAEAIEEVLPRGGRKIHPATLVFQAIRMQVNEELDSIKEGIQKAIQLLAPGGRLGVISFHSFEDRIVKYLFRDVVAKEKQISKEDAEKLSEHIKILTKKPLVPSFAEIRANRRARSAKLRFIEKV